MNRRLFIFTIVAITVTAVSISGLNFAFVINHDQKALSASLPPKINIRDFSPEILASIKNGFILTDGDKKITVGKEISQNWSEEFQRSFGNAQLKPNEIEIKEYLDNYIVATSGEKPKNPRFAIKDGQIYEIQKSLDGVGLDIEATIGQISTAMFMGKNEVELVFERVSSDLSIEKLSMLGINKLIGQGKSDFSGSPAARIHNIKTATEKYNGILIEPEREFSFNEILGEVDAETGFKAELVIKGNKIIPEYGGGICQVSTTVFRAALNSGLPIIERRPHSLPVRYYKPQGFDATIYPGVVDLKFNNDTGGYILMQSEISGNNLIFEFYGADDRRNVKVGEANYYDVQPDGALKSVVTRTITYEDGVQKSEKFYSSYKSPDKFESLRNPLE